MDWDARPGRRARQLKFRKQMVLSNWSGRIRTWELEEEALRNNWKIDCNFQDGSYDKHSKDSKTNGMDGSDWRGQISTQKIEVETSKNHCAIDIDQGGHRGKHMLLKELRSRWD